MKGKPPRDLNNEKFLAKVEMRFITQIAQISHHFGRSERV